MIRKLPIIGNLPESGANHANKEYWTTVARKKVYSKSMEALCRTVAYGWSMRGSNDPDSDLKYVCLYCGQEGFSMNEPCSCFHASTASPKRANAMVRLHAIMHEKDIADGIRKAEEKKSIITPK